VFVGAYWGFFFSRLLNAVGWMHLPESNFTLVGMAGLLSGVMYCPLTAIFLIAEITNGYGLIIPLMIVSSIAYFIAKTFEPYYMETKKLALEGQIFTHKRERNILSSLSLASLVQKDHHALKVEDSFKDLIHRIQADDKNIFAVLDPGGRLVGIIEMGDIKSMLFQPELYDKTPLKSILKRPPEVLSIDTPMTEVMHQFDLTGAWYLPVVDGDKKFIGFVSKSRLFERYRNQIAQQKDIYED
jgi:chloride channel protein, CIC family